MDDNPRLFLSSAIQTVKKKDWLKDRIAANTLAS